MSTKQSVVLHIPWLGASLHPVVGLQFGTVHDRLSCSQAAWLGTWLTVPFTQPSIVQSMPSSTGMGV